MPIFEYKCGNCEKEVSVLVKNSSQKNIKCPECGSKKLKKLISSFAGVVKEPQAAQGGCCACDKAPMCPNAKF
jgi:putative FmdB family regulatory protein